MPRKKQVFISYSHNDSAFVDDLEKDLIRNNLKAWRDVSSIPSGRSIIAQINEAIQKVDHLIIVLSPDSMSSMWVEKELSAALNLESSLRRSDFVIPVLIEDCEIPPLMKDRRYADFRADYGKGLGDLLKALQQKRAQKSEEQEDDPLREWRAAAKRSIEAKRARVPEMRPGYDLGNPVGDLQAVGPTKNKTEGVVQYFDHGMIVWHAKGPYTGQALAVYGTIYHRYKKMGEECWIKLGFPIDDEQNAGWSQYKTNRIEEKERNNRERYSAFENGEIVWYNDGNYQGQTYALWDPIRREYDDLKGSNSYLGYPISEPYKIREGERCDFEGGSIVALSGGRGVHAVRQLLRIDYADAPANHDWKQYAGKPDAGMAVRHPTSIGKDKSYIALNKPRHGNAIQYPAKGYEPDDVDQQFCGITIKSLIPGERIRFYIKVKAGSDDHYLEFDTQIRAKETFHDKKENVEYWRTPLPSRCNDGQWYTAIVDLRKHVKEGFKKSFRSLRRFYFREYVGIADLVVSDNMEATKAVTINPIEL